MFYIDVTNHYFEQKTADSLKNRPFLNLYYLYYCLR